MTKKKSFPDHKKYTVPFIYTETIKGKEVKFESTLTIFLKDSTTYIIMKIIKCLEINILEGHASITSITATECPMGGEFLLNMILEILCKLGIENISLEDYSTINCMGIGNCDIKPEQSFDLWLYYILKYGKTWYQMKFQFSPADVDIEDFDKHIKVIRNKKIADIILLDTDFRDKIKKMLENKKITDKIDDNYISSLTFEKFFNLIDTRNEIDCGITSKILKDIQNAEILYRKWKKQNDFIESFEFVSDNKTAMKKQCGK